MESFRVTNAFRRGAFRPRCQNPHPRQTPPHVTNAFRPHNVFGVAQFIQSFMSPMPFGAEPFGPLPSQPLQCMGVERHQCLSAPQQLQIKNAPWRSLSPMPFGGEPFGSRKKLVCQAYGCIKSPMPFGGEPFGSLNYGTREDPYSGKSPMPFGGEPFGSRLRRTR